MNQRGAVLVTLTYALPLAGIVLFVLLAIAYYVNTTVTLEEAVANGVRTASTRGKVGALWRGYNSDSLLIQIQEDFPNFLSNSLVHRAPMGDHLNTYTILTEAWGGIDLDGSSFEEVPPQYHLALAFTLGSIQESLGSEMVRYPCGVQADVSLVDSEFANTPGCLICYPLRHTFEGDVCAPEGTCNCDAGGVCSSFNHIPVGELSNSFVSIACRHNPNDLFLRPLVGLFSAIGTDFEQQLFIFASSFQDKSTGLLVD